MRLPLAVRPPPPLTRHWRDDARAWTRWLRAWVGVSDAETTWYGDTQRVYYVTVNGKELTVRLGADGTVALEGRNEAHEVKRVSSTEFSVIIGARQVKVVVCAGNDGFDVIAGRHGNAVEGNDAEGLNAGG